MTFEPVCDKRRKDNDDDDDVDDDGTSRRKHGRGIHGFGNYK